MTLAAEKIEDWPAELERLAKEAEREALAKADEIFAEALAEHERQTAGYKFDCRRFGDFLTVFVERSGNLSYYGNEPELKFSTSLNLGKTRDIRLIYGHCFDRCGELTYGASHVSNDRRSSGWGTGYGRGAPGKGYHYEVTPSYPYIPKQRPLVAFDPKPEKDFGGMCWGNNDYQPRHRTKSYPRPAKDDVIRFEGIGASVHAPAGRGQAVYDAIMAEIERADVPSALPERPVTEQTEPETAT